MCASDGCDSLDFKRVNTNLASKKLFQLIKFHQGSDRSFGIVMVVWVYTLGIFGIDAVFHTKVV